MIRRPPPFNDADDRLHGRQAISAARDVRWVNVSFPTFQPDDDTTAADEDWEVTVHGVRHSGSPTRCHGYGGDQLHHGSTADDELLGNRGGGTTRYASPWKVGKQFTIAGIDQALELELVRGQGGQTATVNACAPDNPHTVQHQVEASGGLVPDRHGGRQRHHAHGFVGHGWKVPPRTHLGCWNFDADRPTRRSDELTYARSR